MVVVSRLVLSPAPAPRCPFMQTGDLGTSYDTRFIYRLPCRIIPCRYGDVFLIANVRVSVSQYRNIYQALPSQCLGVITSANDALNETYFGGGGRLRRTLQTFR